MIVRASELQPRISVLMTVYNRADYLGAAIASVLAQTYSDWELVIVDDGSRDASVAIAQEYAARDPRIRLVVNERNLGQFPNRNRAAQLARGEFLKYHDSDDLLYPHCLATMVTMLAAEPRAGFALSSGSWWPGGPCPMLLSPRMCYQREFLGAGLFHCGPGGALFRSETFHRLGGFPEMGVGSDHLFWLKACAREHVLLVPADLLWYRSHPGQEFHKESALLEYSLVVRETWRMLQSNEAPLEGGDLEQARKNFVYLVLKLTVHDLRAGRWRLARHRLRISGIALRDWVRYLRRPRRNLLAGTPLDANAQFLMPWWLQEQSSQRSVPLSSA